VTDLGCVLWINELLIQGNDISNGERRQADGFKIFYKFITKVKFIRGIFCRQDNNIAKIYLFQSIMVIVVA